MGKKAIELVQAGGLNVDDVLKDLNRAYCDEWLAYHAYKHMAEVVSGPAYEDMQEFLEKTADNELEHTEELAARITELGGVTIANPGDFEKNANYPYPAIPQRTDDYSGIIDLVTKSEAQAMEVYEKLIKKTMGKDNDTYQLISHIQGEEVAHEERFANLLSTGQKEKTAHAKKTPEPAGVR